MASEAEVGVVEWPRWHAAQLTKGYLLGDLILLLVWMALLILFAYLSPFFSPYKILLTLASRLP